MYPYRPIGFPSGIPCRLSRIELIRRQSCLAAYFCIVDFSLLAQFFYYRSRALPISPFHPTSTPRYQPVQHMHRSLILPSYRTTSSPRVRSASHPLLLSNPPHASASTNPNARQRRVPLSQYPSAYSVQKVSANSAASLPPIDGSYAAIYEAALDVARAAERASHRRSQSGRQRISQQNINPGLPEADEDGRRMLESFHSEMSAQSSMTEENWRSMSLSTGALLENRDRSLKRTVIDIPEDVGRLDRSASGTGDGEMREASRNVSRSVSLARG